MLGLGDTAALGAAQRNGAAVRRSTAARLFVGDHGAAVHRISLDWWLSLASAVATYAPEPGKPAWIASTSSGRSARCARSLVHSHTAALLRSAGRSAESTLYAPT